MEGEMSVRPHVFVLINDHFRCKYCGKLAKEVEDETYCTRAPEKVLRVKVE